MALVKRGNLKINETVGIFNLPTRVCGTICKGCYARKAEIGMHKAAVNKSREANLEAAMSDTFVEDMKKEIARELKRKKPMTAFRPHESGDFFSQEYVDKWVEIVKAFPQLHFYTYTKKMHKFDFSVLANLPNMNLINSMTNLGFNYGDQEHCNKLIAQGYAMCPCRRGVKVDCGKECTICHTTEKVCFLIH